MFTNRKISFKVKCLSVLICLGVFGGLANGVEIDYPLAQTDMFSGNVGVVHSAIGAAQLITDVTLQDVAVPAGSNILKAYLYWGGVNIPDSDLGDDQVTFTRVGQAGTNVTADYLKRIIFAPNWGANHMICISDVTPSVAAGTFDYRISDFMMDDKNFGMGLQIVYENESLPENEIKLFQGADFAFSGDNWTSTPVYQRTVPVVQEFTPDEIERQIKATFFAGDAMVNWPGTTTLRPDRLWYKTGSGMAPDPATLNLIDDPMASQVFNPLASTSGAEWDTVMQLVNLPADDTWVAFQFESGDGSGTDTKMYSSFTWISAAVEIIPEPTTMCMITLAGLTLLRRKK